MMNPKLDNQPYERGMIAIYEDFTIAHDGSLFINKDDLTVYSNESIRWHLAQAQESVDDIIYTMINS